MVLTGCLFFLCINTNAQLAPKPIPTLIFNSTTQTTIGNDIDNYGKIETNGYFNMLIGSHTNVTSNKEINIKQPAFIKPNPPTATYDPNNVFHAKVINSKIDMVWFTPNSTPGIVEKNDKLELGIKLPFDVEYLIDNFASNSSPNLNPFNPEDIDIKAEFFHKLGTTWSAPQVKYGFFYNDFTRNTSDPDANKWNWTRLYTDYRFRVRFTPQKTGEWKCKVTVKIANTTVLTTTTFNFDCTSSTRDNFMSVSPYNNNYFHLNNKSYFPIGHNMPEPSCFVIEDSDGVIVSDPFNCESSECHNGEAFCGHIMDNEGVPIRPKPYVVYQQQLIKLRNNNANFVRMLNKTHTYELEFEKLGNYYNRMHCAWELDKLIELIEPTGLKMYFTLTYGSQFFRDGEPNYTGKWNWDAGSPATANDNGNCYMSELGLTDPHEFLTNSMAKKHFKNKLRYIISRWGYSTGIAIIELMNEINTVFKNYPNERNAWQIEMADYIKNVLGHKHHLISVNNAGGTFGPLAPSFATNDVDVASSSYYRDPSDRLGIPDVVNNTNYSKPFLFSETGTSGASSCEDFVEQRKDLWTNSFSGSAGGGFNWHNWNDDTHWKQFNNLHSFVYNINFDNFTKTQYLIRNDKLAEMQCLVDPTNKKSMGVITNNSWNFWTSGLGGACDNGSVNPSGIIKIAQNVSHSSSSGQLVTISGLQQFKKYYIEWYDALNNNTYISTSTKWTTTSGKLILEYPTLTLTRPIIAFKAYPKSAGSFILPVSKDSMIIQEKENDIALDNFKIDSSLSTFTKDVVQDESFKINVFPNPTHDYFSILIPEKLSNDIEIFYIFDSKGNILMRKKWSKVNAIVSLEEYSSGMYTLVLQDKEGKHYRKKIILQ